MQSMQYFHFILKGEKIDILNPFASTKNATNSCRCSFKTENIKHISTVLHQTDSMFLIQNFDVL